MVKKVTINESLDLTTENGYFLQQISGLGYKTRFSVNQILSRHGAKLGNAVFDNKSVRFIIAVLGETPSQHIARRNLIFQNLSLDQYSTDDKVRIDLTLSNNQELMIEGIIESVDQPIDVSSQIESMVSIALTTEFPFLRSEKIYTATIPIVNGGGASVPMTIPLDFTEGASGGYTTVANGGNVFSFPVIRFYGPLEDPVLTDVVNNKSLSLAITIDTGDYIEIDTYERTVIDQDSANQLDTLSGEFLTIPASTENRFKLTTGEVTDTGYVTLAYPYTYVSI